jgi:hypothetical protein
MQNLDPHETIKFVLPYKPAKEREAIKEREGVNKDTPPTAHPPNAADPDAFVPITSANTSFSPDSQAPYTKFFVDANLPGGIFEEMPYLGFAISVWNMNFSFLSKM